MQSGINIEQSHNRPVSFFHGQIAYHETINSIRDELNTTHSLSRVVSKVNVKTVLFY